MDLNGLEDQQLVALYDGLLVSSKSIAEQLHSVVAEIWLRMHTANAMSIHGLDSQGNKVEIVQKSGNKHYIYIDNILETLKEYLSPEEYSVLYTTAIKWDKREINKLMKRGNPWKEVLDRGILVQESSPVLEIKPL